MTTDVYAINEKLTESTPTTLFEAPTRARQITVGEFQQLLSALEKSSECLVSPCLKTSTFDNKETIGFTGTARPYWARNHSCDALSIPRWLEHAALLRREP